MDVAILFLMLTSETTTTVLELSEILKTHSLAVNTLSNQDTIYSMSARDSVAHFVMFLECNPNVFAFSNNIS